jgi:hypothetical protein
LDGYFNGDADSRSAFQQAAYKGRLPLVVYLLRENPELADEQYEELAHRSLHKEAATPLLFAIRGYNKSKEFNSEYDEQYLAVIRHLLKSGADPNKKSLVHVS